MIPPTQTNVPHSFTTISAEADPTALDSIDFVRAALAAIPYRDEKL